MTKYLIPLFTFIYFGMSSSLSGQTNPLAYWNFETDARKAQLGPFAITGGGELNTHQENSLTGSSYLRLTKENGLLYFNDIGPTDAVTLECWFRVPRHDYQTKFALFSFSDNSIQTRFLFPKLEFFTVTLPSNGKLVEDKWAINLDGPGKHGFAYLMDGNWHHIAFVFDAKHGKKEIWIDGELPEGFSKELTVKGKMCLNASCDKKLRFSRPAVYGDNFVGDLDELAVYGVAAPRSLIHQHYLEGKAGKAYSFQAQARSLPRPSPIETAIDFREYAPDHPKVGVGPVDQLAAFPLPRYHPAHQLRPHYNWLGGAFMGGYKQEGVSMDQVNRNSTLIQKELGLNWNYMITVLNARAVQSRNAEPYLDHWIALANEYPKIPFGLTTLWAQVYYADAQGKRTRANVLSQTLPNTEYIRDANGVPMDRNGNPTKKDKYLSPLAQESYLIEDAKIQAEYIRDIQQLLTRPINFINENGEIPFFVYDPEVLKKDPVVVKDKEKSGIASWADYQAYRKNKQRSLYRDVIYRDAKLNFQETPFSWYGVDAGPIQRYEWQYAREIQSPINGQHYSTPDFYPRWPSNWYKWGGAWRGWQWLEESRKIEIQAGDHLFSPFVAAGWDANPEKNVRPTQYLGLLKNLGVIGAEFFYPGFFNVGKTLANPNNYVWQAAIPSYAQAITSRYEYILREGNVLMDAEGNPILRTWAGNPMILATVRKHPSEPIYLIGTTLQPLSNAKGAVADSDIGSIEIEGNMLQISARRQGSMYYYDRRNPAKPVFYQLDSWHETGHPWYWSKDFAFEAEVHDFAQECDIQTEFPAAAAAGDLTEFTSYLTFEGEDACAKYEFQARANATYRLNITARNISSGSAALEVLLDGKAIGTIKGIRGNNWKEYSLSPALENLSTTSHQLTLKSSDQGLHLDAFVLQVQ